MSQATMEQLQAVGITLGVVLAVACVWYVLQAVAFWKIFTKAGEKGWKSLIPFYNEYCLFRISWKNTTVAIVWIVTILVGGFGAGYCANAGITGVFPTIFNLIELVGVILAVVRNFKESKAFGHGVGFGLGLTFITPIFNLILGFSNDKYVGPQD